MRQQKLHILVLMALAIMIWAAAPATAAGAAEDVGLVIDGQKIQISPAPVIKDDRTLVPVRLVSENLGAQVQWQEETRTVCIIKGKRTIVLRIDNRLVDYQEDAATFSLCDVPPQILDNRTFVPLRLVSNALGVSVVWDGESRTVTVDSRLPVVSAPAVEVTIPTIQPGQVITSITDLQIGFSGDKPGGATEIRFYLLDPRTGRGTVIARGNLSQGTYRWLPDPLDNGSRVLAAAVYDQAGRFLVGHAVPVELAVAPQVSLTGVAPGQVVKAGVDLGAGLNFIAQYVKYEFTAGTAGNVTFSAEVDPQGAYNWIPLLADNGSVTIRAIAYDRAGQAYYSSPVNVTVEVPRQLELKGVSSGSSVTTPVTLWLARNFPVNRVEYLLVNPTTGKEEILFQADTYASYKWFPGPEKAGTWELKARVRDSVGNSFTSNSLSVQVVGNPLLLLESVGPDQVLTGTVKLKSSANIALQGIEYKLIKPSTGASRVIAGGTVTGGSLAAAEYSWTPEKKDEGSWKIQAVGVSSSGERISSEAIPVRVYLGTIYQAKPIIEKSKFQDFASQLAVQSREKTGMSAALQVAQAILETGWGQSTPVDKYTGQLSYNLFGIKGKGSAGSVTSNTWEEYNGNSFRIDADFRAYHNPAESWEDHKRLLLTASRYQPFREVMHNSTLGAWALKRAGYATDSQYPLKLMNLIKTYNLHLLDEVQI